MWKLTRFLISHNWSEWFEFLSEHTHTYTPSETERRKGRKDSRVWWRALRQVPLCPHTGSPWRNQWPVKAIERCPVLSLAGGSAVPFPNVPTTSLSRRFHSATAFPPPPHPAPHAPPLPFPSLMVHQWSSYCWLWPGDSHYFDHGPI